MVVSLKSQYKMLLAILHDSMMILLAYVLAFQLRFDFSFSVDRISNFYEILLFSFLCKFICFQFYGLYHGIWRYASTIDLVKIIQAVTSGVVLYGGGLFFWNRAVGFPKSIFVIDSFLLIFFAGGGRLIYRVYRDKISFSKVEKSDRKNILILGAGDAAQQLIKEIQNNPSLQMNVVGLLDDKPSRHGRSILGIKILGPIQMLNQAVRKTKAKEVVIAIPSAGNDQIRRIVDICLASETKFKTLPRLVDLTKQDSVSVSQLREVSPEDLLGRDQISLETTEVSKLLDHKTILVTGAGGSIGSEICRQIIKFKPSRLILFEISELFIFNLDNELKSLGLEIEIIPIIGDIKDRDHLTQVFKKYTPELVFHAAAYKHVPLMEHNPDQAIKNNVHGTCNVAEIAALHGVTRFVMISTDKAVNPTNIMGTSKRIAEMICCHLQGKYPQTKFITVRFGNVLGSNGSVVKIFKEQIKTGGPLTVTHPEIKRYFMSIPEASQLVLQASTIGDGGQVLVLDMGEQVKIIDLAKDFINLAGLTLGKDIDIKITGLRPGEKLYEELFSSQEEIIPTTHIKINIAKTRGNCDMFENKLTQLENAVGKSSIDKIQYLFQEIVPEYTPDTKIKAPNH